MNVKFFLDTADLAEIEEAALEDEAADARAP